MAAKTWTLTSNSTGTGSALDSLSTSVLIRGTFAGGYITLEASQDGTNYAPISSEVGGVSFGTPGVHQLSIPAGWYVRPKLAGASGTPSVVVAIE